MADAEPHDPQATLPRPRTALIGREQEVDTARRFLLDEAVPLLTLTGPGGVGKTRLAAAIASMIADRFADGVIWSDLVPLEHPGGVAAKLAAALGISPGSDRSAADTIVALLRSRQSLLILDNCEHVLAAAADLVATLLARCPALQVLATSRAPLRVRGEQVLSVSPLLVPEAGAVVLDQVRHAPAVRLFVQRARAVDARFALDDQNAGAVAAICQQLDGLPLAIELAASRSAVLSPAALHSLLGQRFQILGTGPRDAPARHHTMRDAIAWSYALLGDAEQRLFRNLAVFAGGWSLAAAAAVSGLVIPEALDRLETLVDHHLIARRTGADAENPRFSMLETIRQFALERLTQHNEDIAVRARHAAYFGEWLDRPTVLMLPYLPDSRQVLDRLVEEYPNVRAAMEWHRTTGDGSAVLQIAGTLFQFWLLGGQLDDGRMWLEWGLTHEDSAVQARTAGQLAMAGILHAQDDDERALVLCRHCLGQYQVAGDAFDAAYAFHVGVHIAMALGEPTLAASYIAECATKFSELDGCPGQRAMLNHLDFCRGWVTFQHGDPAAAAEIIAAIAARQRTEVQESGVPQPYLSWTLVNLGHVTRARGDPFAALAHYQASLNLGWQFRELSCCARALAAPAGILAAMGHWLAAARLYGAAEAFCKRYGLGFRGIWNFERAFGLPEPWSRADEPLPKEASLVRAVARAHRGDLPPLPVPEQAAEAWAIGRMLPFEEAMAEVLSLDPSCLSPISVVEPRVWAPAAGTGDFALTKREHEVLGLLCEHLTDREIAGRLFLSPRTVEAHVRNVLAKLGVVNRREAAAIAARTGLV